MAGFLKKVGKILAENDPAIAGLVEMGKDFKALRGEKLPDPALPPPVLPRHVPTEQQLKAMRGVAERDLSPATPARVPSSRPTILRGPYDPARPLTSSEIQQRAREGIAAQRADLGTPITPFFAPAEEPKTELNPHQLDVIQKMAEQNKMLHPDRFPPATTPAGTRTNKRKSKGGIGSFGMSLINTDLPK
jgi:hypothetical protein